MTAGSHRAAPRELDSLAAAVDCIVQQAGPALRVAMPLGIGKPNPLINALYARVQADPALQLDIYTALSLLTPQGHSELETRFLAPLVARLYGNYPDLAYVRDLQAQSLPPNVRVHEFFLKSGDWLEHPAMQQHYISSNYTHIARDMAARRPNVLMQAVAAEDGPAGLRLSLSSNPDVSQDLLEALRAAGEPVLAVAVVNRQLPFMGGSADVDPALFDLVVTDPAGTHDLFTTPAMKVSLADHAIGLQASRLVRDGGTLQIGIGSLGDAIAHALVLRHHHNAQYRALLQALPGGTAALSPDAGPFVEGLYGCSEMLVSGLLELMDAGIIRREVMDPVSQQPCVLHGGFFLGPPRFYQRLREMPAAQRSRIAMQRITFINQLYGDEALKRDQRRKAAFINTCMMVTLSGAAVSDALENGQVVSGVGGQYNFVAMAHALPDARSILMLRSWRLQDGKLRSNIVTHYGHCTIPRHLRDIVITEYGVADLRGRNDSEVIAALLAIADSRFQPELQAWAVEQGKLPADFVLPAACRENTPEALRARLAPFREQLPDFPFGHDFTDDELVIIRTLEKLKHASSHPLELLGVLARAVLAEDEVPERYLKRLGLDAADSLKAKWLRRLFAGNL